MKFWTNEIPLWAELPIILQYVTSHLIRTRCISKVTSQTCELQNISNCHLFYRKECKSERCKQCKRHFYMVTTVVQNTGKQLLFFSPYSHMITEHMFLFLFPTEMWLATFLQHLNNQKQTLQRDKRNDLHNTSTYKHHVYNTDTHERKNNRHFAQHDSTINHKRNSATYGWTTTASLGYCATSTLN